MFIEDYQILKDIFELNEGYFQGVDKSLTVLEYFQKNVEGLLNKLTFSRKIRSDLTEGKMYYFF